jgi:hypothetical protein
MKKLNLLLSAMVLPMANLTASDGLSASAAAAKEWLYDLSFSPSLPLLSTIFEDPNDHVKVQCLIDQGANVNFSIPEYRGCLSITPLQALYISAWQNKLTLFPLATLQALLDAGADPEKPYRTRPSFIACLKEELKTGYKPTALDLKAAITLTEKSIRLKKHHFQK